MKSSTFALRTVLAAVAVATSVVPVLSLPKPVPVALEGSGPGALDGWNSSSTCSVYYYDPCSSFNWYWSPQHVGDTFGVVFDSCGPEEQLSGVWTFDRHTVPAGWGYTGVISVHAVDENDAPAGPTLASAPFLADGGWNYFPLSTRVPPRFVVTARYDGGINRGPYITTDRPVCIDHPEPHSFYFGTPDAPLSPGEPFWAAGYTELFYRAEMNRPTALETSTWGNVKSLYR